jgi:hypothetical protein
MKTASLADSRRGCDGDSAGNGRGPGFSAAIAGEATGTSGAVLAGVTVEVASPASLKAPGLP